MTVHDSPPQGRREEVLNVAATVFSVKGYRSSTIQDIAKPLGFTTAALYYYFGSKLEILSEIIMRPMNQLVAEADAVAAVEASITHKLSDLVHRHIHRMLEERHLFSVLLRERVELDAADAAKLAGLEEDYYRKIRDLVEEGVARGELRVESPEITSLALVGMMNWTLRWYREDGSLSASEIADAFFKVFYNGTATRS